MIGGEIEIDPECGVPSQGDPIWAVLDLPYGRSALFGTAREAVRWWADNLRPDGDVLVPAYCCRSVVQPFREAGVPYRYYPVGRDLRVQPRALRPLVPGAGAIQVMHYFGFPAAGGLFDLGVPVLEDAVQALFAPNLRNRGDWAIGSLRKYFAVADGAFLTGRRPFSVPRMPPAAGGPYGRKVFGRMLKHDAVRRADGERWTEALAILDETEEDLDRGPIRPHAMSRRTSDALRGAPLGEMAAARRSNYRTLFDSLRAVFASGERGIRPLLGPLPDGVVPYGLPLLCESRDALRQHLADRGIVTAIHWDLPDDVSRDRFPDSWWVHERTLTLPIDHRYGAVELAAIAEAVGSFRPSVTQ